MANAEYQIPANIRTPQGEIRNTKFWLLNSNPTSLVEGLFWFDSVNHIPKYYDGENVKEYGKVYTNGSGIAISAQNVISVNLSASDIPNLTLSKITDVTASASELNILDGATLTTTELNYVDGVTSSIQTQLNNKLTKNTAITGATKCKITYDTNGLVTGGANLSTSDIPDLSSSYIAVSAKGANNGVASLGADGKVPNSQLPAYVDDVIDAYIVSGATALSSGWLSATSGGSALTPETGKIYVILSSGTYLNKTYRWSGTTYVEISASPANATESAAGIAEIATLSETLDSTEDTKIVTPKKVNYYFQKKLTAGTGVTITTETGQTSTDITTTISVNNYNLLLKNNATGSYGLAIGTSSTASATGTTAIGYDAIADYNYATALGYKAKAKKVDAIQLGYGINNTAETLYVGFYKSGTSDNYELLDGTTGLIPDERISSTIKNGAAAGATAVQKYAVNNPQLTASGGVATWEITHGLGTDDVCLTVKNISTGEIVFPAWKISSGKVTIEFLTSSNIAADTYRAIVMG